MNLSPNLVSPFLCKHKEWMPELTEDLVEVEIIPYLQRQQRKYVYASVWDECTSLLIEN